MASGSKVAIANTSTYIQGCISWDTSVNSSNQIVVNVRFYMRRTNAWSGQTYSSSVTQYICISSDPNNYSYSETDAIAVEGGMQDVWQGPYFSATRTFDASRSGATIYVGWKTVDNSGSYFTGSNNVTITLPVVVPTPSITGLTVTSDSTSVGWFVDDGVGSLNGTGYLYGGTSPSPTTQIATTTLKNDTFVNTGLTPNTTYYYRGRIKDSNNNWGDYTPDLTLTTSQANPKFYGSVNGETKEIVKLYGPSNKKYIYGFGISGITDPNHIYQNINTVTFSAKLRNDYPLYAEQDTFSRCDTIVVHTDNGYQFKLGIYIGGSLYDLTTTTTATTSYGISFRTSAVPNRFLYIYINTSNEEFVSLTKEVTKLYGSVNGETELIYEA